VALDGLLACGVWISDWHELMEEAEVAMYADSACGTLYAVAVAMLHAAGPGARATALTRKLAARHPALDNPAARGASSGGMTRGTTDLDVANGGR
jgi:hypothetical protein